MLDSDSREPYIEIASSKVGFRGGDVAEAFLCGLLRFEWLVSFIRSERCLN